MSSSRALLRALDAVFEQWRPTPWPHDPPAVSALYSTIYAYIERHNTLAATPALHDDLHAVYVHHIRASADLAKETFFLDVLTRLSPVLGAESVRLWLQTYLRPAVDSAGFDSCFVSRARAFVSAVAVDVLPTGDEPLARRRAAISAMAMDHVLRLYLGDAAAYAFCGLAVAAAAERQSQLSAERVRFVENNACALLRSWGLKHPRAFADASDRYFQHARHRHKVLRLLSQLASSTVASTQAVFDSPLFASLLRSLCVDRSESVLGSALGALLMLVGKVCHRAPGHLPVLLAIYSRLVAWQHLPSPPPPPAPWDTADVDPHASIMKTQIYSDGRFNLSFLLTLLYALFPSNVMAYARSPLDYLQTRADAEMGPEIRHVLAQITASDSDVDIPAFISSTTTDSLKNFLLHPNFVNQVSLAQELANPIQWILQKNEGQDMAEEEVMIECFGLNPQILFAIADGSLPENFPASFRGSVSEAKGRSSKRSSLQSDIIYTNSNTSLPAYLQNMDRRVSIVPTRLVLDDSDEKVTFKQFSFDGSSFNSDSTIQPEKPEKKDQLSDLYSVHEKLFTSSTPATNSAMLNTEAASAENFQGGATATDMLAKQLKPETVKTEAKSEKEFSGTALDFYQRELLLMKNELEFSSYMKHLNKTHYVKLKLKYNKLLQEKSVRSESTGKKAILESPQYLEVMDNLRTLQLKSESESAAKSDENVRLFEKVQALQSQIHQLDRHLAETRSQLDDSEALAKSLDAELKLRTKEVLQLQAEIRHAREMSKTSTDTVQTEPIAASRSPMLSNAETEIVGLQTDLQIVQDAKNKLRAELDSTTEKLELIHKTHENELAARKLELGEALRQQAAQHERKIKELTALVVKYEMSLEKEMARNVQLSKAKPIRIPEIRSQPGRPLTSPLKKEPERDNYFRATNHDYFGAREPSSGSENQSLSPPPSKTAPASRQSSMTTIPIIKGRGGYQKRSKKM